jgi:hypothetical protein
VATGQAEIAAEGGADRRFAKNAGAPMDQSREALLAARPLHSPEGGQSAAVFAADWPPEGHLSSTDRGEQGRAGYAQPWRRECRRAADAHTARASQAQLVGYARLARGRAGAEELVSEAMREGASPHPSRRLPVGQTPELHRYRWASRRPLGKMAAAFLASPAWPPRPMAYLGHVEHVQPP